MDILAQSYEMKGMVRCASHHFTVAINNHTEWICADDLCVSVRSLTSNSGSSRWFFAVFKKFSCTMQTDLETDTQHQAVFSRDRCYETMQNGT